MKCFVMNDIFIKTLYGELLIGFVREYPYPWRAVMVWRINYWFCSRISISKDSAVMEYVYKTFISLTFFGIHVIILPQIMKLPPLRDSLITKLYDII